MSSNTQTDTHAQKHTINDMCSQTETDRKTDRQTDKNDTQTSTHTHVRPSEMQAAVAKHTLASSRILPRKVGGSSLRKPIVLQMVAPLTYTFPSSGNTLAPSPNGETQALILLQRAGV